MAKKLTKNTEAPDFSLPDSTGKVVSLHDFKGKHPVIVYFYPKDFTPVCTKEACFFRDSYEDFTKLGAEVIGISADSVESHNKFQSEHKLPFTLLSDSDNKVRKSYQVPSALGLMPGRVTFVIDKNGVIQYSFNSMMNASQHVKEALRILTELQ